MKIPQKGMNFLKEMLEKLDPQKYMLLIAGKCSEELEDVSRKFEIKNFGYIKEQKKMNDFLHLDGKENIKKFINYLDEEFIGCIDT
jgi:glycogen synthase